MYSHEIKLFAVLALLSMPAFAVQSREGIPDKDFGFHPTAAELYQDCKSQLAANDKKSLMASDCGLFMQAMGAGASAAIFTTTPLPEQETKAKRICGPQKKYNSFEDAMVAMPEYVKYWAIEFTRFC